MAHFRGQIRGPHWGPTMDNMLIDFWRKHECLFNSSNDSYYDKNMKTKLWTEFAVAVGKPVCDVERRSRSLRTQYGRLLWHPERVSTFQQKMLRDKLDFLRPYIVRRRGDSHLEEKIDNQEEDDEELETEGSFEQDVGSSSGSLLDADADPNEEPRSATSSPNPAPLHCPNSQPQVTEVISLSCPHQTATPPSTFRHDILNQFAEVMLADMRQIKNHMVLMRLRRDITDLVFKAVEEDAQRQCHPVLSVPVLGVSTRSCSRSQQWSSQTNVSWRQGVLNRKNRWSDLGRRRQRWEELKHIRRASRGQLLRPTQQGHAHEDMAENSTQASEIKRETEPHIVKIEEETPALA
ncbi:uncharacterized protein LOC113122962 [Mastacembelus armatus]|uniref:uncharacterized protein LOC113122962 n=1 Tax=Mastacembelus armatus TaxID=205130 RepID=UPI000E461009|nr:uncharacterized protein LOC113122962 [Mastacembelus armatus]